MLYHRQYTLTIYILPFVEALLPIGHLVYSNFYTVGFCVQVHIRIKASFKKLYCLYVTFFIEYILGVFTGAVKPFNEVGVEV